MDKKLTTDVKMYAYVTFHIALKSWSQGLISFEQFLEITRKLTAELKAAGQTGPVEA